MIGLLERQPRYRNGSTDRAAVVKIMASGGVMTPGTDMLAGQFSATQLRVVVEEAHRLGLPAREFA